MFPTVTTKRDYKSQTPEGKPTKVQLYQMSKKLLSFAKQNFDNHKYNLYEDKLFKCSTKTLIKEYNQHINKN